MNNVYIIKNVDTKNILLKASKNPVTEDSFEELTNETYPKTSFIGKGLSVPISKFTNGMVSDTEMILNILDN